MCKKGRIVYKYITGFTTAIYVSLPKYHSKGGTLAIYQSWMIVLKPGYTDSSFRGWRIFIFLLKYNICLYDKHILHCRKSKYTRSNDAELTLHGGATTWTKVYTTPLRSLICKRQIAAGIVRVWSQHSMPDIGGRKRLIPQGRPWSAEKVL